MMINQQTQSTLGWGLCSSLLSRVCSAPVVTPQVSTTEVNNTNSLIVRNLALQENGSVVSLLAMKVIEDSGFNPLHRGDSSILLVESLLPNQEPERLCWSFCSEKGSYLGLSEGQLSVGKIEQLSDFSGDETPVQISSSSSWVLTADKTAMIMERLEDYMQNAIPLPPYRGIGRSWSDIPARNCLTFFQIEILGHAGINAVNPRSLVKLFASRPQDHIGYVGQYNCVTPLSIQS